MDQVALLGISIVAIAILWRFGARKTYLDEARDRLFDLRDAYLKPYFEKTELGLRDPLYVKLRGLLNSHLRYTEKFSFVSYVSLLVALRKKRKDLDRIQRSFEREFYSEDATTRQLSDTVRRKAAEALMIYMVKASLLARFTVFVVVGVLVLRQMKMYLASLLRQRDLSGYMRLAVFVAMTAIPTHFIPGLPANATQNAIEVSAADA